MSITNTFGGLVEETRLSALRTTHPIYTKRSAEWRIAMDAYEGTGGYLDGSYLWQYKNELIGDYTKRQTQARYHNIVESLVDIYIRHIFGKTPTRTTTDGGLEEWWTSVDGAGMPIETLLRRLTALALSASHAGVLVDKTREVPTGPSVADEKAHVIATLYPPTSIADWRYVLGKLVGLKLLEAVEEQSLAVEVLTGEEATQYLLWDQESWARYDRDSTMTGDGEPQLGLIPFAVLRPKSSLVNALVGRPLIAAALVQALFNRCSEEDEVLRGQSFEQFVVEVSPMAPAAAIVDTQQAVQLNYGVNRALVVPGTAKYVGPSMTAPAGIRDNIEFLIREIYRAAFVSYDLDTKAIQSAEAITNKHADLNAMLQGLASELTDIERQIARFYFAWTSPTEEAAQAAFDAAEVTIVYPREFFLGALLEDLQAWAEAIQLSLGPTFEQRLKQRAVRRIDPDLAMQEPAVLADIDAEIEDLPAAEDARMAEVAQRRAAQNPNPPIAEEVDATRQVTGQVSDDVADKDVALNGAQVTAMIDLIGQVAQGQIPRETGVAAMVAAFSLSEDLAEQIMGSVGRGFVPRAPEETAA